jgi:methionyl-tRNA formyltransferase
VLVKTFPFRIPASVLKQPKYGFINFHYAPLPKFRGSNPLFWMIKEQVTMGGVTVHQMDETFDTGPILFQVDVPIMPGQSFGLCSTQLAYAGLQLTVSLIQALQLGNLNGVSQPLANDRWYGRPTASDIAVNWNKMNALQIVALANACNPWLKGAPTKLKGWMIGITNASISNMLVPENVLPGTIISMNMETGLVVVCHEQTSVKIEVVYTEEGFLPGHVLLQFGMNVHDRFDL